MRLQILRGHQEASSTVNRPQPYCKFVNVQLKGIEPSQGTKSTNATVLLENPRGEFILSKDELHRQVGDISFVVISAVRGCLLLGSK